MRRLVIFLGFALLLTGCSQSLYLQGRRQAELGQHEKALADYLEALRDDPDNFELWREIGIANYRLERYDKALQALQSAAGLQTDARTQLFLGMTCEKIKRWDDARLAYQTALDCNPPERLRNTIDLRLERLSLRYQIDYALTHEAELTVDTIPGNTIAVYDFNVAGLDPEMEPIALGLAEFTAIDLAKVKSVRVVERIKMRLLQEELGLSRQGVLDQESAPRFGRILGTRNLVTGTISSPREEHLSLNGVIINTLDKSELYTKSDEEKMQQIFDLQKSFVFHLIEEMGITMTKEERDAIREVPTESYLAFLAYCKGLQYQRQGKFEKAREQFQKATTMDEGFSEATQEYETTSVLESESTFEDIVQSETTTEPPNLESSLTTIVDNTSDITSPQSGEEESAAESSTESGDPPADSPPVIPRGAISVKGVFDE
jgi:tetratricopeptide (TPR) repeat protein